MWADESVFYHIYPLGFCGAEPENDFASQPRPRLTKIASWFDYLIDLGVNAIYLGPVFEATRHGYDTADYFLVDRRLGTNHDLKNLVGLAHQKGLKVILDGVFNHVGRHFFAFENVLQQGLESAYCSWFKLNFEQNNRFNDGFCYEGWDGCDDIVKLNLKNPQVKKYLLSAVVYWIKEFDIDGLRLDVAHYLDRGYIKELRKTVTQAKKDFWMMGEIIMGDYRRLANPCMLDATTNYECYKGLHSSCNDNNMYEIAHSLNRQFAEEQGIYRSLNLYNFLDNHDVSRIASMLKDRRCLKSLYTLMFSMPGIPSLYYGSEWGLEGCRDKSDAEVRPALELQNDTELTKHIRYLAWQRRNSKVLAYGNYNQLLVDNDFLAFTRTYQERTVIVAINIGARIQHFNYNGRHYEIAPYGSEIFNLENSLEF